MLIYMNVKLVPITGIVKVEVLSIKFKLAYVTLIGTV